MSPAIVAADGQLVTIVTGLCRRIESRHYFRSMNSPVALIYSNCMHFDHSDGSGPALACTESDSSDCLTYFDQIDPFADDWLAVANSPAFASDSSS